MEATAFSLGVNLRTRVGGSNPSEVSSELAARFACSDFYKAIKL